MKKGLLYLSFLMLLIFISCEELGIEKEEEEDLLEVTFGGYVYDQEDQPIANAALTVTNKPTFYTNTSGYAEQTFDFLSSSMVRDARISISKMNYTLLPNQTWNYDGNQQATFTFYMEQTGFISIPTDSIDLGLFETTATFNITNTTESSFEYSISTTNTSISLAPSSGKLSNDEPNNVNFIALTLDRQNLGNINASEELRIDIDGKLFKSIKVKYSNRNAKDLHWVDEDGDQLIDIRTIDDLHRLSLEHNRDTFQTFLGFELMRDLDFNNTSHYKNADLQNQLTQGEGWLPIGLEQVKNFTKRFEGNGFSISNLFINRTTQYGGLFAYTSNSASIVDLALKDVRIVSDAYSAGLVGWNRADIDNCSVTGNINATNGAIGLLVGRQEEGEVTNCYTEGSIQSPGISVGGLIGNLGSDSRDAIKISKCYANVTVRGDDFVGGLIGRRYSGVVSLSSCYAKGNVLAQGQNAGGLIGYSTGTITNCYAFADISSNGIYIGGLVGENLGIINSCFSTGKPKGSSSVGGLIGRNSGSVTDTNYWDIETSDIQSSAGGSGYSTLILQGVTSDISIYTTWDEDIWDFGTSSEYPALKNMPGGIEKQRE